MCGWLRAATAPGLSLEAGAVIGVGGELRVGGVILSSDIAAQSGVVRPIHLAHAAGAEGGQDLVRAETCAGG